VTAPEPFPKIELHVHAEGTIRPETLLEIAGRNGVALPAATAEELHDLFRFTDFEHFIETWLLVTAALVETDDFRRIVVEYAEEAAAHGAVYVETIFAPTRQARRGIALERVFEGYCDGVDEARERVGLEVRLTPDLTRGCSPEEGRALVRQAIAFRERGVVAVGLGGREAQYPPELYADLFRLARDGGLGSVPHAGEDAGPESIRGALDGLGADRLRHGFRAVEDPGLVEELAGRGIVLDTCLTGNVRTGVVPSLAEHPLPRLIAAGVRCSLSTDDPAMFDTDLTREYMTAGSLGLSPHGFYEAGVAGALCDETTRARLGAIGRAYDWSGADEASSSSTATARS
jgi:aminodeoxyfutalosine deaminase